MPKAPHEEARDRQIAKDLFHRIRDARDSEEVLGREFGQMIEQFRKLLNYSPKEFSEQCQISQSTYYRWVGGDKPPAHKLEKLRACLKEETPEQRTRDSIISGDRRVTLRTFEQVLDRQIRCKNCWVIKNALPYRAAKPGIVEDTLFSFLSQKDNNGSFHCVFFGSPVRSDEAFSQFAAMESFGEFKQNLYRRDPTAAKKLRGWLVKSEALAFRLGLTNGYLATDFLEYDLSKTVDLPNLKNREVDILIEIPLAVYQAHNHLQLSDGAETRWMELAPEMTTWDWRSKKPLLYKLAAGGFPTAEVEEFLVDPAEIESFQPKRY